jgi:plasmid stabilization system protein ParE
MSNYTVVISEHAQQDLRDLSNTINFEYKSPVTAFKYLRGIYTEMRKLKSSAETYVTQKHQYFSQYGVNVRRLNYKKMAIIYTIKNDTVYIRRVVPSSTITGL